MNCPSCSTPAPVGALFCDNCGFDLRSVPPQAVKPAPTQVNSGGMVCTCGSTNPPGSAFCENCGAQLGGVAAQQQYQQPPQQQYQQPPQQQYQQPPQQQYQQPPQQQYQPALVTGRFVVQGTNATITFPSGKSVIIIGREDPVSGVYPEIDMDAYGGHDAGVGRQHAKLTAQGGQIFLEDMNSVNGTAVNKQKLPPGQKRPLQNGDEVRFGKMILIYYLN